ncbi:hypothetical protein I4U23_028997 [Adineta vaga]|nr:hypothetical protein I4U23_028997 [Adineta vaga]
MEAYSKIHLLYLISASKVIGVSKISLKKAFKVHNFLGRMANSRFTSVDRQNQNSLWFSMFNNWYECVCMVLSSPLSSTAIAINMYRNGSCQLFVTLPLTYTMEINTNSTLILFKQLPARNLAPCCSNLSWLMTKLSTSPQISANMTKPTFLILDDNNYLVTVGYRGPLVQFNRTTLNVIQSSLVVNDATSISYHNGFYYLADCPSNCVINILLTKNLSFPIASIPITTTVVRNIAFIRNNSLMLIASNSKNQTLFFDVLSTTNYTPSTPSFMTVNRPCGVQAVNDTFIYITSWFASTTITPVSTLTYTNNTWLLSSLPNTTPTGSQKIFQTTIDSCGRLWLAITGLGIRIFDPWGNTLLYEWSVTTANKILYYNPNILQCTS